MSVNQNIFVLGISALLILISIDVKSQKIKEFDYPDTREIRILAKDSVIIADVMIIDTKLKKLNEQGVYYWYQSNKIWSNEGAYDGQLLHGDYEVKDKEGRLIQKGHFENGLKDDKWITWFSDGQKETTVNWKMGEKNGKAHTYFENGVLSTSYTYKSDKKTGNYQVYNSKGTLIEKGKLKDGAKNGTISTYDDSGELIDRKKFKNGTLVEPKQAKEKSEAPIEKTRKPTEEKDVEDDKPKKSLKFWKKDAQTTEID